MGLCVLSLPHIPVFGIVVLVSALMYLSLFSAEAPYLALLPQQAFATVWLAVLVLYGRGFSHYLILVSRY